ncbi:hypothetical protein R3P38DRAFT_3228883 [Favolaschia claudopus]|uniref:NET domain-containing protein n=1 Tax=Favolaschia claudopus TaxID=2862362 RepID=A0AAV9ZPB2_9AGAR
MVADDLGTSLPCLKNLRARITALPESLPVALPDGPLANLEIDEGEEQQKRIARGKYGMDLICPFLEFYAQQEGIKGTDGVGMLTRRIKNLTILDSVVRPDGSVIANDFFAPKKAAKSRTSSKAVVPAKRAAGDSDEDNPNDKSYRPARHTPEPSEKSESEPEEEEPPSDPKGKGKEKELTMAKKSTSGSDTADATPEPLRRSSRRGVLASSAQSTDKTDFPGIIGLTFQEKQALSEAVERLYGRKLQQVFAMIQAVGHSPEIELEMDSIPANVLMSLYELVLGPRYHPPQRKNGRTCAGTGGLKRMTLDEDVEAERIRQLEARLALFNPRVDATQRENSSISGSDTDSDSDFDILTRPCD